MNSVPPLPLEDAETIGLRVVAFLVQNPTLLERFMEASGVCPQELKNRFQSLDFLGGVLDFLLKDDTMLLAFCEEAFLSPERLVRARQALPGASLPL